MADTNEARRERARTAYNAILKYCSVESTLNGDGIERVLHSFAREEAALALEDVIAWARAQEVEPNTGWLLVELRTRAEEVRRG